MPMNGETLASYLQSVQRTNKKQLEAGFDEKLLVGVLDGEEVMKWGVQFSWEPSLTSVKMVLLFLTGLP